MKEQGRISAVMAGHGGPTPLDFSPWENEIRKHPRSMLFVRTPVLEKSFRDDMAVVLLNGENKFMAGARFIPLLDRKLIEKMGLPEGTPEIFELGSVVVLGQAQGNGLSRQLNQELIDSVRKKIADKKLLIIGTAKTVFLLKTLAKIDGAKFTQHSPDEFPMIEPLTCVCNGEMGCGMQTSTDCPARIKLDQVAELKNGLPDEKGNIPCTLFVSDEKLALQIEETLRNRFAREDLLDPQKAEVELLMDMGYYN